MRAKELMAFYAVDIAVAILVFAAGFGLGAAKENGAAKDHWYPDTLYVADVNETYNMTAAVTIDGVVHHLDGTEWKVGDVIAVLMDDNGTPEYKADDLIIEMNHTGNLGLKEAE